MKPIHHRGPGAAALVLLTAGALCACGGGEQHKGRGPQASMVDRFHVLPSGIRHRERTDVSTMRGAVLKVMGRALKRS